MLKKKRKGWPRGEQRRDLRRHSRLFHLSILLAPLPQLWEEAQKPLPGDTLCLTSSSSFDEETAGVMKTTGGRVHGRNGNPVRIARFPLKSTKPRDFTGANANSQSRPPASERPTDKVVNSSQKCHRGERLHIRLRRVPLGWKWARPRRSGGRRT